MSQYQPNAAPGRSFIEKINLKFSNLSLSSSMSNFTEKDGSNEDETLIHNAFVAFYDTKGELYPDWLGVKKTHDRNPARPQTSTGTSSNSNSNSSYQPVRASYNSVHLAPTSTPPHSRENLYSESPEQEGRPTYTRRSNSRLQEMYNKSRQQSIPGASYNAHSQTSLGQRPAVPVRTNTAGQRLRDRVLNGSPQNGSQGSRSESPQGNEASRATWGRN